MGNPKPPIFTREQETQLLEQYDEDLRKYVSFLCWKKNVPQSLLPDMMQEARLAFLVHVRRISKASEIDMYHIHVKYAIIHFLESTSVVHIPHHVFSRHKDKFERTNLGSAETETYELDDDLLTGVCFEGFLDTLPADQREMLELKLKGYKNREIRKALCIDSEYSVSRQLSRLRKRFERYLSPAHDAI